RAQGRRAAALRGPGHPRKALRAVSLSTVCWNGVGRSSALAARGGLLHNQPTGLGMAAVGCQGFIHGADRSVNDLDIHSLHSAYCYGLLMISIKRKSYNGGQLS